MATELEELLGFLSSPSPQVKKAAVDIVRGLTGSEDGLKSLANHSKIVLPSLGRLLVDKKEISEPAVEALVNLSQDQALAAKMIEMDMIKIIMHILYTPDSSITKLLVMFLVNLTQSDSGVASLLQMEDEKGQGIFVMKLVRSFCRSSSENTDDPFDHVGSILVNISKDKAGRKFLLDPKRGLLKQIVGQFDSTIDLRRKGLSLEQLCTLRHLGVDHDVYKNLVHWCSLNIILQDQSFEDYEHHVAGTIRHCCFEAADQLPNLLLISEFLWPALLLPVAGNKVYSEQDISKMPPELASALSIEREPVVDPEIRVQVLEAIYLITLQDAGRRAFWSVNGPRILQLGYEDEEDPKVMRAFEQVGSLLVEGGGVEPSTTDDTKAGQWM